MCHYVYKLFGQNVIKTAVADWKILFEKLITVREIKIEQNVFLFEDIFN